MSQELAGESGLRILDNSGPLEDSVRRMLTLIAEHCDRSAPGVDYGQG